MNGLVRNKLLFSIVSLIQGEVCCTYNGFEFNVVQYSFYAFVHSELLHIQVPQPNL